MNASEPSTTPAATPPTSDRSARLAVAALLALFGIVISAAAYQFGRPDGPVFFWGILPGVPFVLLAAVPVVSRKPLRNTLGAFVGGLLAVAVPYGSLVYASANYTGGGANISLGLLLLATPVTLPVAMRLGWFVAGWLGARASV